MATELLSKYSQDLKFVDIDYLSEKYKEGYHGQSNEINIPFLAEIAVGNTTKHPDYGLLGGRLMMHQLHLNTSSSLLETYENLSRIISPETIEIIKEHEETLQEIIDFEKDFNYDFFGFKTLERTYLLQGERPQQMLIRIAIGIHGNNINEIADSYRMMSNGLFTHATPTMINAGTKNNQMSSCFLIAMKDDSISGIYDTLKECALISKMAGGIGMHIHNIRAKGSYIQGTNGTSDGVVPMLRVFNNTARYVDQCLHPNNLIYTTKGLIEIKECKAGETVVFTTRGPEVIKDVLEFTHDQEMLVIDFNGSNQSMIITGQHLVSVDGKWKEAGELEIGDEVSMDTNFETETKPTNLTDNDLVFYGIMLVCGDHSNCYCLTHNADVKDFLRMYLTSLCVKFEVKEDRITWERNLVIPFRYSDFSNGVNENFFNLPAEKRRKIIFGISMSQGSLNNHFNSIRFLLMKSGMDIKDGNIVEKGKTSRISNIRKINYSGVVFDLQMEKTHNYFTYNGLVHNGGGKRKGAFAIYLEPWHADIIDFLNLKRPVGKEEDRARDLFYGLWIPDLFMKRVREEKDWTLFDPHECPGLSDTYGEEFEKLYETYEKEGRGNKTIKARTLFNQIIFSQVETGTPYMLYKDACNKKSNQKNLGTIKCSNLCTEIIQYSSPEETSVCNLASIGLPKFVTGNEFDFGLLYSVTRKITRNLNQVIDRNFYPTESCRNSNLKHRPIGIGIQGLADVFAMLGLPFTSPKARKLNEQIFETIYFAACSESVSLAEEHGAYETFKGSPASKGMFQFNLWGKECQNDWLWNWESLREDMCRYGLRNSLMVAPMPTASTSQILGNNECFEPFTSNIYLRKVLSGDFAVINKHLVNDLVKLGLWNDEMRKNIIRNNGSVQNISEIPENIREIYKTVWEIKMKDIIDMAADRGKFIDQSQSMSLFLPECDVMKMYSMHQYAWEKGLKTGMYYFRSKSVTEAKKVTMTEEKKDECTSCGS